MKLRSKILSIAMASVMYSGLALSSPVTLDAVKAKFPGTPIKSVQEVADFPGVYEMVVAGNKVFYINKNMDKMMIGHIFDLKTRADETQARINSLLRIDFKSLPLDHAIKVVKGNGKRVFAVFSDPECPFCRRLEAEIKDLNNITMYIFPMPIANPSTGQELHPGSVKAAEAIWCSKDKYKAWHKFLGDQKPLKGPTKCENPIKANMTLGDKLGINGTPTIVSSLGVVNSGWMPAPQLEKWLDKYAK